MLASWKEKTREQSTRAAIYLLTCLHGKCMHSVSRTLYPPDHYPLFPPFPVLAFPHFAVFAAHKMAQELP